jgi:NAD(P)-dependent dehydrogenase (short-subunit alcohol dehydrogenase family)
MRFQSDVERACGSIDRLDHLVLTAVADELARCAPIAQITNEQVERSFDKTRGFVNVVRAAAPRMSPAGSLTFLAGASALKPGKDGFSVLATESASIIAFGKALALELAPLRVNVLVAGLSIRRYTSSEELRTCAEAAPPRSAPVPR